MPAFELVPPFALPPFALPPLLEPPFAVGDEVEISTGPLAGIRGRLEESRGTGRFVVSIPSIAQGIRFHVEGWNLKRAG